MIDTSPMPEPPHTHDARELSDRALRAALVLNLGFLIVEAVIGFVSGSLALLSDAAHMTTDVVALLLALVAARMARRPPSPDRSFGMVRAEVLGAFANGLFLVFVCALIFKEAIERLMTSSPAVDAGPVLVVGILGLAINLGSVWYLARGDRDNLNIRAALVHMLADALGSVGAILAAVFLHLGYSSADPLVSLAIGGIILFGTWRLIRDAGLVLLQFSPRGVCSRDIRRSVVGLPGVRDVHDLHVWSLDQSTSVASLHVVIDPDRSPAEIQVAVAELLARDFDIQHTTVQCELESDGTCGDGGCTLCATESR